MVRPGGGNCPRAPLSCLAVTEVPWVLDGQVISRELSEAGLAAAALALGALETPAEGATQTPVADPKLLNGAAAVRHLSERIAAGEDPLGDAFCRLRSPLTRRADGATYTPVDIVQAMIAWTDGADPVRVVDPGAGSGRYATAAGRKFPKAELIAVELDPLAALLARAHLRAAGLHKRSRVLVTDYRACTLPRTEGRTVFVGNPPYVRHHQIAPEWKAWLTVTAKKHKLTASQLAGLHVHFFLATLEHGAPGDRGAYITSSEWLDTNYGGLVRSLLLSGLGGLAIHMLAPTAMPFEDATTTGAITCFEVGAKPRSVQLRRVERVEELGALGAGPPVARERLVEARRWTPLLTAAKPMPEGFVELGELCRVHRGAVTGLNKVWIQAANDAGLPESVLFPSITRARELFAAGTSLDASRQLRFVVDLPPELDEFQGDEKRAIDRFLRAAKKAGAADGYIARHRRAWWAVGLRDAAPILATYMARRPPAFVRNLADARHINIAHGIYPREELAPVVLDRLRDALRGSVTVAQGRTYAGGLTKFEPKEMERLPVPSPELLSA